MQKKIYLWLPILAMVLITPFSAGLDLAISRFFYNGNHFVSNGLVDFIYNYGFWPADFTVLLSLIVLIASLFVPELKRWRKAAFLFLFTMALGAGLIVHAGLKDHWGRPRPKQTIEFGGTQPFRPFYKPNFTNQPEPSKSFTCGHCTTGFCFFALAVAGRRMQNRKLYIFGMVLALGLGIVLSVTRIAQGGHFFTDTLMSAIIMWYTVMLGEKVIYERKQLAQKA